MSLFISLLLYTMHLMINSLLYYNDYYILLTLKNMLRYKYYSIKCTLGYPKFLVVVSASKTGFFSSLLWSNG